MRAITIMMGYKEKGWFPRSGKYFRHVDFVAGINIFQGMILEVGKVFFFSISTEANEGDFATLQNLAWRRSDGLYNSSIWRSIRGVPSFSKLMIIATEFEAFSRIDILAWFQRWSFNQIFNDTTNLFAFFFLYSNHIEPSSSDRSNRPAPIRLASDSF